MKTLQPEKKAAVETLHWYRSGSGLRPSDFIFYINFMFIALPREAEPKEIDCFRLAYLGEMTRQGFETYLTSGMGEMK